MMTMSETDPSQQPNPGGDVPATVVADTPVVEPTAVAAPEVQDGEAKPASDGKEEASTNPPGAPEAYESFTVPDGLVLEGERLEQATAFFKENGWSQEQAQKAVDFYSNLALKDGEAITGTVTEQVKSAMETEKAQKIEQWGVESKTLLGDKYDATVADARLFIESVNDPELGKVFDDEGWGNHPKLIKAFALAGQLAKDSNMPGLGGLTTVTQPRSIADVLYDHPTSKT